jgi:hypothetical protein
MTIPLNDPGGTSATMIETQAAEGIAHNDAFLAAPAALEPRARLAARCHHEVSTISALGNRDERREGWGVQAKSLPTLLTY